MPSSVPPPMDLYEKDADGKVIKKTPVAPHDWRRLQDVDLDDIVAQYGIQAASTRFLDQHGDRNHEPFRYGSMSLEPASNSLPTLLNKQLDSLTKNGRAWHKQTVQARQKSHPPPALQTQLPLSSEDWRNPSPLDLGAPNAAKEQRLTPYIKPWQQIVGQKGKGPATEMRLYLSNVQSDLEQRMIQQLRVQAVFDPKHWAGSTGEKELIRLEERHKAFVEDLDRAVSTDNIIDCPPEPSPEEQLSPTKRHSKYLSPTEKQIRRILVFWDTYRECHVLDQLPASFLNQFHAWVDIYKVSAPLLRVQSGFTVGKDHYSQHVKPIALKDMMRVLGFRPGYSLPTIVQSPYFNSNPEPGMNAVRLLGVLARLVAYPATVLSTLEVGRKKQTREFWDCLKKVKKNKRQRGQERERAVPEEMPPQPFYCVTVRAVFAEDVKEGQEGQEQGTQEPREIDTDDDDDDAYATLPNNFRRQSEILEFLHARGLNRPDDISFRYERLDLSPHPSRFCVHFDTLEQATAAKYAFNLSLRGSPVRLHAWLAGS